MMGKICGYAILYASLPFTNMASSLISPSSSRQPCSGFALVIALSLMAFVLLLLLSITTLVQVESRSAQISIKQLRAEQSALLGLQIALGELQKTAGPDQRVTAVADILANDGSKTAVAGRHRWAGVWDTSGYSAATPDTKTFKRWLVSSSAPNGLSLDTDAQGATLSNPYTIFEAVDPSGSRDVNNDVIVEKIPISNAGSLSDSYYAYWVEDEGGKADLAWNEGTYTDDERKQAARLSSSPGVDYDVFASDVASPFNGLVAHPIEADSSNNGWLANIGKAVSTSGLPLVTGSNQDATDWLKAFRHDITFGSRAVLCDVKNGGLRRDLSLAFEMDGNAESEDATLFNQQNGEFVAGSDNLAAIQNAPEMTVLDRFLFRDLPGAGNDFSGDITVPETVVRGPSWWLLRDYANLYKRLSTSGNYYALDARAYFPNRTTANPNNNLIDIHAQDQRYVGDRNIKVHALNRETNSSGGYAFRPIRASYAPVLLGVNAIYSLVYKDNKLQMVVDPFFIIWNPYDSKITADKFAVTLENGFAGGVRFRVTDPDGDQKYYGKEGRSNGGSDTSFYDFAKRKSGLDANLSYLITDLSMNPGEVLIYSPPIEADRSSDANVLNDELLPGMNYDATTSGIWFDEFPYQNTFINGAGREVSRDRWETVETTQAGQYTIDLLFNLATASGAGIANLIETNLPASIRKPNELNDEARFGEHVAGKEFRLNHTGSETSTNVDTGARWDETNDVWPLSYTFSDLGAAKKSFGILSMLTIPTDYDEADTALEVFSQFNVTAPVCTNTELYGRAPFNMVVKSVSADGYNNLMNAVGIDLDALGSGNNGFYGKSYDLGDGDSSFPLLSIPKSPLYSLVEFSGANIGTRLFEPTHAIGNSWKPPYIPKDSIYDNTTAYWNLADFTLNDASWLLNDALFDRYYLSGIAPAYTISGSGYSTSGSFDSARTATLRDFFSDDYQAAQANPALEPYLPDGMIATDIEALLTPADGYKKLGAYSLINGAFNVNSTSVAAWSALLRGNKDLGIQSLQGATDSATGTPFPLSSSASDTNSTNEWEKLSRLSDSDISNLAAKIVDEVRTRGPFMSISDFVNRRITNGSSSSQGALQEAIEQAGINGNQSSGIRAATSDTIPNYSDYSSFFPYADVGDRNNATGIPMEINQANILLPIAPKLTARSDTFKIRAYGEVTTIGGGMVQAICEATVQRVPGYINPVDDPWSENYANPLSPTGAAQLDSINQTFGRRFKVVNLRWLDQSGI